MGVINFRQNKDLEFIFQVGVSPNFYNQKLGVSPIHVAANEGESEKVDILIKNKAEVNVVNAEGLSGMFTNTIFYYLK